MIDFFVPCKMQCIRDVNIVADMLVKFCSVNEVHAFDVWDITSHVLEQVAKGVLNWLCNDAMMNKISSLDPTKEVKKNKWCKEQLNTWCKTKPLKPRSILFIKDSYCLRTNNFDLSITRAETEYSSNACLEIFQMKFLNMSACKKRWT